MRGLFLALLLLASPALAQTPQNKASMIGEINTNLADNIAGLITPAILRTTLIDMVGSYQQFGSVNAQVGVTYTFSVNDYGVLVTFDSASPVAVTLPQAVGSFTVWNVYVRNAGTGVVTITPTTSLINGVSNLVVNNGQSTWIISSGGNYTTWITGTLVIGCSSLPALTGDVTTPPGSCVTSYNNVVPATKGGTGIANSLGSTMTLSQAVVVGGSGGLTLTANGGTSSTFPAGTTTLTALNAASQTISGGANVTSLSLTAGSFTANCGLRPLQFITNNAAFTITAPVADGSCLIKTLNGAAAGAITFSGFSVGVATGDTLTTTNNSHFTIGIWRINAISGYRVAAHQ